MLQPDRRSFGRLLRSLRGTHALSQRALASVANVSARHVSFLESGRAQPSRSMVMQFAVALALAPERTNELLQAAGFAPTWPAHSSDCVPTPMLEAIARMMDKHEPYPLYVCNRARDVLHANRGALKLLAAFAGSAPPTQPLNVLRLLFDPALRSFVVDWDRTAMFMLALAHRDLLVFPEDRQLAARLQEIRALEPLDGAWDATVATASHFTVRFAKDSLRVAFFTTVTKFGGPQTRVIDELTIESWFPLDAETEAVCASLASDA